MPRDWRVFFVNQKEVEPCTRDFSRPLRKLKVIAMNFDCFTALFALVVIGWSS